MGDTFVSLDDAKRSEYAKSMAVIWTRVEELKAKKARDAKRSQEAIDEELEEIGRICRVINDDGETKDQLSLFVPEEQAKQALAEIMARQEDCTPINARECPRHGTCACERLEDEAEDEAPAVKSSDCPLHGVNAPHATEPPAKAEPELNEPQIVEQLAAEAVAEWARLEKTPESVKERNARVKEAIAAHGIPVHRRKPFGQAVARLLSDVPSMPASAGASDAPPEVDGNVAEEQAEA